MYEDVWHSVIWATCILGLATIVTMGILYSEYNASEADMCRGDCYFGDSDADNEKELTCIMSCNEKFQDKATSDKRFLEW